MIRRRKQKGTSTNVEAVGAPVWDEVSEKGKLNVVKRAKRLTPVDKNHRTKASISDLVDDTLKPLQERHHLPDGHRGKAGCNSWSSASIAGG